MEDNTNNLKKRNEMEKNINMEVMKDQDFLKKLQENPHKALQEKFNTEIPSSIKIVAHLEEPNTWHFVIRSAAISSKNLSESQLENLAAGDCWM